MASTGVARLTMKRFGPDMGAMVVWGQAGQWAMSMQPLSDPSEAMSDVHVVARA